jgi:signal transduction histidine kinase
MNDISLHILDIVQNSIEAQATKIKLIINTDPRTKMLELEISDNGKGMEKSLLNNVSDPFVTKRKSRKVGLGLPLLKDSAENSSGKLNIFSIPQKGTVVKANFEISHIDRPPLGSIGESLAVILSAYPEIDMQIVFSNGSNSHHIETEQLKKQLGEVAISDPGVVLWIKEYVDDKINQIFGGVLDEVNY